MKGNFVVTDRKFATLSANKFMRKISGAAFNELHFESVPIPLAKEWIPPTIDHSEVKFGLGYISIKIKNKQICILML